MPEKLELPKGWPPGATTPDLAGGASRYSGALYKGAIRERDECWAIHYMEENVQLKADAVTLSKAVRAPWCPECDDQVDIDNGGECVKCEEPIVGHLLAAVAFRHMED